MAASCWPPPGSTWPSTSAPGSRSASRSAGAREALIIAGATGISSSAIVTKLLVELRRLANPETRLILGIIVLEDFFLALYLAALAPVLGQADGAAEAVVLFVRRSPS